MVDISKANIPDRFKDVSLESYLPITKEQREAKTIALSYVQALDTHLQDGRGITLFGNVGTGKTHLAVAVLIEAIKQFSGYFITEDGIFDRFKKEWNDPTEEFKFVSHLQKVRFLVIDDMGIRKPSDYVSDRYEAIINTRYAKGIPTLITTNKTPNELSEVYERQMSRLAGNIDVMILGDDARKMRGVK